MKIFYLLFASFFITTSFCQKQQHTTPVPILKQINKHNEDGSYSYGYEAADGTYKIETKYPNGEVYGKYGYVDDQGQLREVEYGASRRGFEPSGSEITVAPPTVNNNNNYPPPPLGPDDEDDGQYREDPSVYYQNEQRNQQKNNNYRQQSYAPVRYTETVRKNSYQQPVADDDFFNDFQSRPVSRPAYQPQSYQQPAYQPQSYQQPAYKRPSYQQPAYQPPAFRPTTHFGFQNTQPRAYNPPPPPPPQPAYNNYNNNNYFPKDPNTNVDYNTGSYSVNYK